jgi:hypothetical protein
MAEVFNLTHEDGTLDVWAVTIVGGSIAVTREAAQGGTLFGVAFTSTGSAAPRVIYTYSEVTERDFRVRFYLDLNTLIMADTESFLLLALSKSSVPPPPSASMARIILDKSGDDFRLIPELTADGGNVSTGSAAVISNTESHLVELHVRRSIGSVSNNACIDLYIDGDLDSAISGVDLYDKWGPEQIRFSYSGYDAGTTGTWFLDEIKANNDGTLIGAATPVTIAGARGRYEVADYGAEARSRYGPYGGKYRN